MTGFVYNGADAHAIYYAACHGHPEHEARLDVVIGSWCADDPDDAGDHVTFSCRVTSDGSAAVDAPVAVEGRAGMFGHKLDRESALANPRLADFWRIVDLVVVEDPTVHAQVYAGS
ncbi:MAG: hypothetical protein H0V19_00160 [Euzebyales bacterium]|nr:hypothetical protein [Euzebyales bacterium]MBA3621628.1 hypothetical protein [Euzebyales bacterium]